MPIRFRPPRDIPDLGLTRGQQERFNAWLRTAFTEIAEDMATLGQSDAPTIVAQETIDVAAGSMRRVTPPVGGMAVRVPAPTPANAGQTVRLMIEAPVGDLTVVSVPGIGDDGKVFQPTINGEPRATFTTSGLVTLTSNGSSDWKSASEFAAESPASVALRSGGAALDAQYLLRSANAQLPNARVADDSTEIDISYSSPGLISWFLKTASVGFSKLANLTGLSVLGRAANSSGVMAAITATSAKQVLRNSGDTLHWEYPVTVGSPFDWIFDGVDDVITAGDVLDMDRTTPRSIFIWYATTDTADPIALGKHSSAGAAGWRLAVSSSGLDWILRGTAQQLQAGLATPAPLDGSMHMLGLTYDGSSNANGVEFYLDTVNVAKTVGVNNLTSDSTQNATNFTVGARSSPTQLFPGGLKHVSVWNRVLTAGEVAQLSNAGEPADLSVLSFFSDCILWYKLDETDATGANGVVDHSASGFDGTAQGGLGPSGAGGQVHSFVEGGGVALDVAANIATVTREALTGFAQAAAGSNATTSAEPLVTYSASGNMSAERVLTTSTTNAVSTAVAGQIQVQRTALTGFAAAAANSNATTSAEPIVTYSASANMSAERVTTSSSSVTVSTSVAGQIEFQRAALTGDVTASANSNATTIANDAVTNAKAANMAANTYKANPTTSSADPQDVAVATNEVVCRAGGNLGVVAISSNGVLGRSAGDLTDINCVAGEVLANLDEGNTSTDFGGQSKVAFNRWLNSISRVSSWIDEFQGNLASILTPYTNVAGYTITLSSTSTDEFYGALNLNIATGTTRGRWTLGVDENALSFNWGALRYFCAIVRTGSNGVVANTQFSIGLVGPFDTYGAVSASALGGTSEGVFWEYVTSLSSGQWRGGIRTGSSTAVTSSGVVVAANTRYKLEIIRASNGATYWYLNDTLVRTDSSASSWPPTAACTFYQTILGDTAGARNTQLDYIAIVSVAGAERYE